MQQLEFCMFWVQNWVFEVISRSFGIQLLRDPATVPYSSKAFGHIKNIKEKGKEQATHGTWSEICCETYECNARVERFDLNLCSNKVPILNTYM